MNTQDLLAKVRKIEIKSRMLSDQIFSGEYHTVFKGKGMSFSEVREYQWGDDVRQIDWNVTARYDMPYVKVFEEEREQTLMLLVDISPSTLFGTQIASDGEPKQKNEILAEICALLAFSALNNQDKVGVIFFTDQIESVILPEKGRNHILRIIRECVNLTPKGKKTDLQLALRTVEKVLKKRSILFLLSDFLQENHSYTFELGMMRRKHDLIGLHIYDARERHLPQGMIFPVLHPETGETAWIDTTLPEVVKTYKKKFDENVARHWGNFQKVGADFLSISTQDAYAQALMRLFRLRERRK